MDKIKNQILLEILRKNNKITPAQFDDGMMYLEEGKNPLEELLKADSIKRSSIYDAFTEYCNAPHIDLDNVEVNIDVNEYFGTSILNQYGFIPIYRFNSGLMLVGSIDPTNPELNQILTASLGNNYQLLKISKDKLDNYFSIYKAQEATKTALKSIQVVDDNDANKSDNNPDIASSPAARFVESIIEEAVNIGASDIHIEPNENNVVVRYRIDGDLHEKSTFNTDFFPSISTRIKILADIDIAEKRIPQDGHISQMVGKERYDFRVSTLPTIHGEKFVIRILDKRIFSLSLKELNFSKTVNETINRILHHPHGIILLTGPTGSGKTTTLYSFLRELNKPTVNIVTIEDPVEFSMEGINQIQVNNKADLTFATSLRSILRQDPDIIMVGEIRDEETAQIAIRAAITGHLVLSTLHTNEAPGAVTRLVDMGVPSYLVSDALVAVISQRLLKRLCPHCRKPVQTTVEQKRVLGLKEHATIYEKNGCPYCNGTGYRGRFAVHEIMYMNDELRDIVAKGDASIEDIRNAAIEKAGMTTLINSAKRYVLNGETSYQDLISMIVSEDRETIKKR